MKKIYIKPSITVYSVDFEPLLVGSGGVGKDEGPDWGTCDPEGPEDETIWPTSLWD